MRSVKVGVLVGAFLLAIVAANLSLTHCELRSRSGSQGVP